MGEQRRATTKISPSATISACSAASSATPCAPGRQAVFDLVETIRQSSIHFRRHEDHAARRELEATLDSLSRDQTIDVVRALAISRTSRTSPKTSAHPPLPRPQIAGSAPRRSPTHSTGPSTRHGAIELAAFFRHGPDRPGAHHTHRSPAQASSTVRWSSPAGATACN